MVREPRKVRQVRSLRFSLLLTATRRVVFGRVVRIRKRKKKREREKRADGCRGGAESEGRRREGERDREARSWRVRDEAATGATSHGSAERKRPKFGADG